MTPEGITVTVNGGEPVPGEWGEVQYMPGLEERVAALEALLLPRQPEWTDGQAEEFRAEWERRLGDGPFRLRKYEPARLPPPAPALTPETAEALLREHVTVVAPGETLVVRVPGSWTPEQAEHYQEYADAATACGRISFPVLVVIGEELAVAPAAPQGPFSPGTPIGPYDGPGHALRAPDYPVGGPGCPGCGP